MTKKEEKRKEMFELKSKKIKDLRSELEEASKDLESEKVKS